MAAADKVDQFMALYAQAMAMGMRIEPGLRRRLIVSTLRQHRYMETLQLVADGEKMLRSGEHSSDNAQALLHVGGGSGGRGGRA
jgi:hypothetical protein